MLPAMRMDVTGTTVSARVLKSAFTIATVGSVTVTVPFCVNRPFTSPKLVPTALVPLPATMVYVPGSSSVKHSNTPVGTPAG